jgi:integrase
LMELGIRYRPPYNVRHTYATVCLMAGMRPAFIAQQLGHSVQMLLTTYAHWMNSKGDWAEMDKLQIGPKLVQEPEPLP